MNQQEKQALKEAIETKFGALKTAYGSPIENLEVTVSDSGAVTIDGKITAPDNESNTVIKPAVYSVTWRRNGTVMAVNPKPETKDTKPQLLDKDFAFAVREQWSV